MRTVALLPHIAGEFIAGWWPLIAVAALVGGFKAGQAFRAAWHRVDPVRLAAQLHADDLATQEQVAVVRVQPADDWALWSADFPYDAQAMPTLPTVHEQRKPGAES